MAAPMGVLPAALSVAGENVSAVTKFCTTRTGPNVTTATSTRLAAIESARNCSANVVEAGVELRDLRALHRARGVEQQQAGAARLGIVRELHVVEGNLVECGHVSGW